VKFDLDSVEERAGLCTNSNPQRYLNAPTRSAFAAAFYTGFTFMYLEWSLREEMGNIDACLSQAVVCRSHSLCPSGKHKPGASINGIIDLLRHMTVTKTFV
jgi:hypothetical protein